jgi:WD40 repeat protein
VEGIDFTVFQLKTHVAVFSPDGSHLVTAAGSTVRVWDAHTGVSSAELNGHTGTVQGAVFSPGGSYLVTVSDDKTARLWNAHGWALLHVLSGHTRSVTSAVFSPPESTPPGTPPESKRIATTSLDGTVRLWKADTGELIAAFTA